MKKNFRFFAAALLIVAAAISMGACNRGGGDDGGNGGDTSSPIGISTSTLVFDAEGAASSGNTVTVTGAGWSASTTDGWIGISPTSGAAGSTFTVTVTAADAARGGTITVTNAADPADTKSITVTQSAPGTSGPIQFYLSSVSAPINYYGGDNIELKLVSYNAPAGDEQSGYRIDFDLVAPLGSGGIADGTYVLANANGDFTIQQGSYSVAYIVTLGNFGDAMQLTSATLTSQKNGIMYTIEFTVGFTENGEAVEIDGIYTGTL